MVKALQTGQSSGGIDPVASLPNAGVVTRANVSQFTAEWPG
jgi:ribose transport system substrate-binding protein